MGKFVTKSVNTYLVFIVIFILVAIAGFSVYYKQIYGTTQVGFSSCQENLNSCTRDLAQFITNSSTLENDLRSFSRLYENQSKELTTTEAELASVKAELASVKSDLAAARLSVSSLSRELVIVNQTLEDREDELRDVRRDLNACYADLNACRSAP